MSKKNGNRVKYNPDEGSAVNPEANYDDVMIKALEKLVKQVTRLEERSSKQKVEIKRLKSKVEQLSDVQGRLEALEEHTETSRNNMQRMQHELEMTSYDAHADEDLRGWMMEEKNKDATDTMMTGKEIGAGMEAMNARRRNAGLNNP